MAKERYDGDEEVDLGIMSVVRLMSKTGVCVGWLDDSIVKQLLDMCVKVLRKREFNDIMLPWIYQIVLVSN